MSSPTAIAARLTPAQRRALLWLPEDGAWEPHPIAKALPRYVGSGPLHAGGLIEIGQRPDSKYSFRYRLTALGQQVRRVVKEAEGV